MRVEHIGPYSYRYWFNWEQLQAWQDTHRDIEEVRHCINIFRRIPFRNRLREGWTYTELNIEWGNSFQGFIGHCRECAEVFGVTEQSYYMDFLDETPVDPVPNQAIAITTTVLSIKELKDKWAKVINKEE